MFNAFKVTTYVNGLNICPSTLPNVDIPSNYSSLNIHSNFLCNLNIMLIVILIFPVVGGCLLLCSHYVKSYKHKPRLKFYAISCFLEWMFTFIVFSLFNINTSLLVNINYLISSKGSLALGILCSLLPIGIATIYFIFDTYFAEFNPQLDNNHKF